MVSYKKLWKLLIDKEMSKKELAEKAGFASQSNITGFLNNNTNGIRFDNLFKMLNAMGCEIIVRDTMGTGKEWKIDMKQEI